MPYNLCHLAGLLLMISPSDAKPKEIPSWHHTVGRIAPLRFSVDATAPQFKTNAGRLPQEFHFIHAGSAGEVCATEDDAEMISGLWIQRG